MKKALFTILIILFATTLFANDNSTLKVLVKEMGGDNPKLEGVSVSISNVTPVEYADVLGIGNLQMTNTTDENGVCEFKIPAGTYAISLNLDGYESRYETGKIVKEGEKSVASLRLTEQKLNVKIPLGMAMETAIDFIKGGKLIKHADGSEERTFGLAIITIPLSDIVENGIATIVEVLLYVPAWLFIILIAAGIFFLTDWKLALFSLIGLLFVWNLGLWEATLNTLVLVILSTAVAMIIGLPLGILAALNKTVMKVITPILDFMQTMPAFVYLIPAVPFFGITSVSAMFAIVIFAIPPVIRLTALGIRQVPEDLIEASDSFGATKLQKLFKLQLPLATKTIMAGVNQTIMLALSMVVIASMIGAQGLGVDVLTAIQELRLGKGFEAGIGVVIIAMILDRVTQHLANKAGEEREKAK